MSTYKVIIVIMILLNDIIDIVWQTHGYKTITIPDGFFFVKQMVLYNAI